MVQKPIGLGYVRDKAGVSAEFVESGIYELEVAGARVPANVTLAPLHDPKMERIKA